MDHGHPDLGGESKILRKEPQQQPLIGGSAPMGDANSDSLAVDSRLSLLVSRAVVEGPVCRI